MSLGQNGTGTLGLGHDGSGTQGGWYTMGLGHSGTGMLWVWDTVRQRVRCIGKASLILTVGSPALSQLCLGSGSIPDLTLKCARTSTTGYNNNNRLFMAPHLVRAQSAYKDIRIHSFYHRHVCTHTHTPPHTHTRAHAHTHYAYMHCWWWIGKTTDEYAEEQRRVFQKRLNKKQSQTKHEDLAVCLVCFAALGMGLCVAFIALVRLPSLKVSTMLLVGLLIYDVFWVGASFSLSLFFLFCMCVCAHAPCLCVCVCVPCCWLVFSSMNHKCLLGMSCFLSLSLSLFVCVFVCVCACMHMPCMLYTVMLFGPLIYDVFWVWASFALSLSFLYVCVCVCTHTHLVCCIHVYVCVWYIHVHVCTTEDVWCVHLHPSSLYMYTCVKERILIVWATVVSAHIFVDV